MSAGTAILLLLAGATFVAAQDSTFATRLPEGVRVVWDSAKAFDETTATRERMCLNGLWRWQPAEEETPARPDVPTSRWGFFKVPGAWPGITDYLQKDSQTVHPHPTWESTKLSAVRMAWYEREMAVPSAWVGRRIALQVAQLNSYAEVFLDGIRAGELFFPGDELDLTRVCRPGATHRLSLRVAALPQRGVLLSYVDSASAREVKGAVARRGLCGDVFLVSTPIGPRITEVRVETSVRREECLIEVGLAGLAGDERYQLRGRLSDEAGDLKEFRGPEFSAKEVEANAGGRLTVRERWRPARLWDPGSPASQCRLELALLDARGRTLDAAFPERFGFREFWIDGRDFWLNGRRLHLSAVPLDNAQVGAASATYAAARESLERLQSFGINFVYTHNYDCEPGAHLAFEEILRAADDVGMLVALSQPHFSHYDWKADTADQTNGYARHAAFYARVAGNHPSVVLYAMSHNATGYNEDMNPDLIDGIQDARDEWANRNVRLARRAEAIVRGLDPGRIIYHHASGNLGPLHAINFYPNFAPIQELSDWFGHWATRGVKPLFLCEYGAPFTWDWTMYRGWYQGEREFGSARVPWEFCLAEWNAQFLGDQAFPASATEKANLRWEARQFRERRLWHRWDYPANVGSARFTERYPIFAAYLTDNWRAFRTWGVSAISPWEHEHFWRLRDGVDRSRKALPVDWEGLQRPGFSPDYLGERYERMDLAFERKDWIATPAAEALYRNNRPLLAYLAGAPNHFTDKHHQYFAGEEVEKTLVLINDSPHPVTAEATWQVIPSSPTAIPGQRFRVAAGEQIRWPIRFTLAPGTPAGPFTIQAQVRFDSGESQVDRINLQVRPAPPLPNPAERIALFDPPGETKAWLENHGVRFTAVDADADLLGFDLLLVGKKALSLTGPAPDIRSVREGLRVVIFEQSSEVLERRLGFRVAEYGLRQVFPRVPDHPVLAGLEAEALRDWRGEATLLSPRLTYEMQPRRGPTVRWCDLPVPRLWRCGNRGSVASVLIEKPARGDFLPLVDGGYSLQYSPLLEYREGQGMVLFCQLDVTGRTEIDPAAETLLSQLLRYVSSWRPKPWRRAVYAGHPDGQHRLRDQGFRVESLADGLPDSETVVILGPGCGPEIGGLRQRLSEWHQAGGRILGIGLDASDLASLPWRSPKVSIAEHLSTGLERFGWGSPFAGVSPADLHLRAPRDIALVTEGATIRGSGVLAEGDGAAYCQLVPWEVEAGESLNLKRTSRRMACLLARLTANLGVPSRTPLIEHFRSPLTAERPERRWLPAYYLDVPEEWDDPYRFFRW